MIDGKLFTGWSDGTFKVQDFNGTTYGTQSTVPLALISGNTSLNRFATEDLPTVTGMFYDPATGRLYFTKTGSTALHYRSFSSQSRIVGGPARLERGPRRRRRLEHRPVDVHGRRQALHLQPIRDSGAP